MLNQPFTRGSCLEKTAWRTQALGTLAGAGIGYAMARPEERTQGAVLGALGGFGLGGGFKRRSKAMMQETARQQGTLGALEGFGIKAADYGIGMGIPGTPLSVSGTGKDVRYEGMRRFVPRSTFERAYEGLDQGLDPQALLELEQNQGTVHHPLMGLLAGSFAGHKLFPKGGIPATVLGGLAGGGAGALYNAATADSRVADMHEAIRGVLSEQNRMQSAVTGQQATTANESTPLLVSRGEVS